MTSAISASTLWHGLWMAGLAALLMAGTPIPAHALPVSATPSISVEQAYDSNVFDDRTGNEQDDYILHIRPAVILRLPGGRHRGQPGHLARRRPPTTTIRS